MRVAHDVALFDLAVLLEETRDLILAEGGMNARDEEVGARVAAVIIIVVVAPARRWRAAALASVDCSIVGREKGRHTGCHGRWGRRCGRERRHCRDGQRAETCCDHARSHEARLQRVSYRWRG